MKFSNILSEAFTNTRRNKARTALTVIAVFIGAFTLALTNSIGTGVSTYIASQLGQIGNDGIMSVSKPSEDIEKDASGISKYQDTTASKTETQLAEMSASMGFGVGFLNDDDIELLKTIPGVARVEATMLTQPKYVEGPDGEQWQVTPNPAAGVMTPDLSAGNPFTPETDAFEIIIPQSYVEAFRFTSDKVAIGKTVVFAINNALGEEERIEATIVGVANKSLFGDMLSMNAALNDSLLDAQKTGIPEDRLPENTYISAIVHIDQELTNDEIASLKKAIEAEGFEAATIKDQLGSIQAVIDGIVGVLNGFAIIALIAAGFGIVNTLLMSVQERTREIGLMKAMGLGSGKIYTLFSTEAALIGLMGTVLGIGSAFGVGTFINNLLSTSLLADLPGLTISLFTIQDVAVVVLLVMAISLLAGTIPSARAARQNPIDALRYE